MFACGERLALKSMLWFAHCELLLTGVQTSYKLSAMGLSFSIGVYVNSSRKRQGVSLSATARKIGISKSHLSEIEHNKKSPSLSLIRKIAKSLNDPELLLVYFRKKFPEINSAYQEAALFSEAGRILKDNIIDQILSEKAMQALLKTKDSRKLATEALQAIFLTRTYDCSLEDRLESILRDLQKVAHDINKSYASPKNKQP